MICEDPGHVALAKHDKMPVVPQNRSYRTALIVVSSVGSGPGAAGKSGTDVGGLNDVSQSANGRFHARELCNLASLDCPQFHLRRLGQKFCKTYLPVRVPFCVRTGPSRRAAIFDQDFFQLQHCEECQSQIDI